MPAVRPQPKVRAISCPNCGGSVELRGMGSSLHATCVNCLSVLDVSHPAVQIVQTFNEKTRRFQPKIPLGTRGKIDGKLYEVNGFQTRALYADGEEYNWDEYVLYNPFYGFRYLSEYQGHWNDIVSLPRLPVGSTSGVTVDGVTYRKFQSAATKTVFVMGEFPWRVQVGDAVAVEDFVSPPMSVSREGLEGEFTWSRSTYVEGKQIWAAFQLKGEPPAPQGVYSNQPNPLPPVSGYWKLMGLLSILLLVAMLVSLVFHSNSKVFESKYYFIPGSAEPSFVTPIFDMPGDDKNVQVEIKTDLENDWAFFSFALINEQTGTAYDFGKEVSYYHGRDSDGSWSEGDSGDKVTIGGVPGGKYYLRVEPEMEKTASSTVFGAKRVNYQVTVKRDVPVIWPYFVAWPFLLIPPLLATFRRSSFETKRWAESDPTGASGGQNIPKEDNDE